MDDEGVESGNTVCAFVNEIVPHAFGFSVSPCAQEFPVQPVLQIRPLPLAYLHI